MTEQLYRWVNGGLITELDVARFWTKVNDTGYCWEWKRGKKGGYGLFKINGKDIIASRMAYILIYGKIPDNLQVLHKCDNPCCVNPDHLFTGTHYDNMIDMMRKGRGRGGRVGRTSKYRGVSFRPESKRWRAFICQNSKMITLGHFATEKEAAKIRDKEIVARKIVIPLNFPKPTKKATK